jgi:hypothetical protein
MSHLGNAALDIEKHGIDLLVFATQAQTGSTVWVFLFVDESWVDVGCAFGMSHLGNAALDIEKHGIGLLVTRHASPNWFDGVGFSYCGCTFAAVCLASH